MRDLGIFFIVGVSFAEGSLSVAIDGKASTTKSIEFSSQEAFQCFRESDFHPIAPQYGLEAFTERHQGDCGIFRVVHSPFYDFFVKANGRHLEVMPSCYLISTPDERVEVISFDEPLLLD